MTTKDEALKQSIETLQKAKRQLNHHGIAPHDCYDETIQACREALTQPEQEQNPVAVVKLMETGGNAGLATRIVEIDDPMREPLRPGTKLYTPPQPAPAMQPLTDEQLRDCLRQCPKDTVENLRVRWLYAKDFARAIEAAHGIGAPKV